MRAHVIAALGAALALSACSSGHLSGVGTAGAGATSGAAPSSTAHSSPSRPATAAPPRFAPNASAATSAARAAAVFAAMTEAQRVGQLLMVDNPSTSVSSTTVQDITALHVGGVILDGNSYLSISETRSLTDQLQASAGSAGLLISTDQEGGQVRRLRGAGFSDIPSAVVQGGMAPSALTADATTWAGQLHAAGVNVDLAPVMDTVPANSPGNPPIGDLDREYGNDPATVSSHGVAVLKGLAAAGVAATVKHFPGLGRVTGNTDTTSGVTDDVTTRLDPYLTPFADAIDANVPLVMMSTAIYARIDPSRPAAFSSTVIGGLLRGQLGFKGIVISDDLGAAAQVAGYSVADRAVDFVDAGGDIVLTVDAGQAATMTQALLNRANSDPAFKAKVDAAALLVLQEKANLGLLR